MRCSHSLGWWPATSSATPTAAVMATTSTTTVRVRPAATPAARARTARTAPSRVATTTASVDTIANVTCRSSANIAQSCSVLCEHRPSLVFTEVGRCSPESTYGSDDVGQGADDHHDPEQRDRHESPAARAPAQRLSPAARLSRSAAVQVRDGDKRPGHERQTDDRAPDIRLHAEGDCHETVHPVRPPDREGRRDPQSARTVLGPEELRGRQQWGLGTGIAVEE